MRWILIILLINAVSFGIALGAALLLRHILARPWRRSVDSHWTERARLAYVPGMALLFLAAPLPIVLGVVGEAFLMSLTRNEAVGVAALLTTSFASLVAVLFVRYLWLRELWGPRVTVRSWLTGFLVMITIIPGFFGALGLTVVLPDTISTKAMIIFCAGILVMVFSALGVELKLFGWIGIMKPAPPALAAMVQQLAALMNVKGDVKVFVLEWAMVNALVWQRNRAVAFSRPLLDVMTESEVRAVAAHELGHLLEPPWVRRIRNAHLFVYLPLAPLAKYGGAFGLLAALVLAFTFLMMYVRFTHRFEQHADRAESEAIADPAAYAMSMTTLHQSNFTPAVMPGKQTHPHLYDRLLAGGIQPDFPRPRPPSRAKPMLAVAATTFAVLLLVIFMFAGFMVSLKLMGFDVTLEKPEQKHERRSE